MPVVGSEEDLALCGWDAASEDGPVFALGGGREADVVFAEHVRSVADGRVVAPTGEGLWRRAPWPVREALFDLSAPGDSGAVLVVGDAAAGRDEVAERLGAMGARSVRAGERLTLAALKASAVVVLLAGHGALPAHAMCVLAARRSLVADATEVAFGLQGGIEFFSAANAAEAAERANIARVHPRAIAGLRAMGALAARRHAAAAVYERLAGDLHAA